MNESQPTEPNADANTFVEKVTNTLAGTNAETKLAPCPFCGGDATCPKTESGVSFVRCKRCAVATSLSGRNRCIREWNTRPESDELKRLRDALETIARQPGPRIPSLSFNMLQDIARHALKGST